MTVGGPAFSLSLYNATGRSLRLSPGRILRHHGEPQCGQCNAARRGARAKRAGARSAQLLPLLCAASLRHEGFACSRTPRPPAPARRRDTPGSRSSVTCRCRRYSRGSSLSLSLTLALTLTCSRSEPRRRTLTLTLSLSLTLTDMPLRTRTRTLTQPQRGVDGVVAAVDRRDGGADLKGARCREM